MCRTNNHLYGLVLTVPTSIVRLLVDRNLAKTVKLKPFAALLPIDIFFSVKCLHTKMTMSVANKTQNDLSFSCKMIRKLLQKVF